MNPLLVVLALLATYRITRLVTADQITMPLRTWVLDRNKWLGYLVTCDWCLSIWVAPFTAMSVVLWSDNRAVMIVLLGLACSAVAGLLSLVEGRLDFK